MDRSRHTLSCLFSQLGIASSDNDVASFLAKHKGIPSTLKLSEADFWTAAQANFLDEAILEDSDWAEIVDSLDAMLR